MNAHTNQKVSIDQKLLDDIKSHKSRRDYHNPAYWISQKKIKNKYHKHCRDFLVEQYGWPKSVAWATARVMPLPRKEKSIEDSIKSAEFRNKGSISDYVVGLTAANLPDRYLDPLAKIRNKDKMFYTKINILADIALLAISAASIYALNSGNHEPGILERIYSHVEYGKNIFEALLYSNAIIRTVQIPYRAYNYVKGKHRSSIASIVNPNLLEAIPIGILFWYDMKQGLKKPKNTNSRQ